MKITKVRVKNLKGLTREIELKAINFIVGPVDSNKTTWGDAIRLGLLGYLPELGKRASDTFRLASGRDMEVELTFDDGATLLRRFISKGDSVKTTEHVPDAIKNAGQLAVMLDAGTYFSLTDRGRVDYVFNNVGMGPEWGILAIRARVYFPETADLEPGWNEGSTPQVYVEKAIEMAENARKREQDRVDTMQETTVGLAGLRSADVARDPDLASLETSLADRRARRDDALAKKSAHEAQGRERTAARNKASKRREEIQTALKAAEPAEALMEAAKADLSALDVELAALPICPSDEQIELLVNAKTGATLDVNEARRKWTEKKRVADRLDTELAGLEHLSSCPYCGAKGQGWRDKIEADKRGEARIVKDELVRILDEGRKAAAALEVSTSKLNAAQAAKKAAEDLLAKRQKAAKQLADHSVTAASREALRAELGRLQPEETPEIEALSLPDITAIDLEIAELEGTKKRVVGRANDLRRLAEAEKERDAARERAAAAKKTLEELRKVQREMVDAAFGPLLRTANAFFEPLFGRTLVYKADVSELGDFRDGIWVSHKTYSGVQKLAAYAGIQMALASKAPCRIMLLDEMARAQNTKKTPHFDLLASACKGAVASGAVDQFLGIIPGDADEYARLATEKDCLILSTG
jgi:hypothetical protein